MAANIIVTYTDDTKTEEALNPSVWKDASVYKHKITPGKEVKSVRLTIEGGVDDALASNNTWPTKK
jgi:hypothetical protein